MSVSRLSAFCSLLVPILVSIHLATPQPALAHRVFLFASVEQEAIVVDGRFSKSRPAQRAEVEIFEAQSGRLLLQGVTDSQGRARFAIPEELMRNPVDLRLILNAGEGHQARWRLSAAELSQATGLGPVFPSFNAVGQDAGTADKPATRQPTVITVQELERIINQALEAPVTPIRQMLTAGRARGPGLVEIIGGVGCWIFAVLFVWETRVK